MKRKFIFLAMMLLTLMGGVNLNVLNAQETVTIGEGTASIYVAPFSDYYNYSISQQIYTSDMIDTESGVITEIAYQIAQTYGNERNLVVYMTETEETEYTGNYDWIPVTDDDIVFEGMISTAKDDNGWFVIELQNTFEYNGGNIAVTVYDRTGSKNSSYCTFYAFEMSESWKGLYNTGSDEVDINSLDTKYGTRVSSYVWGTGYKYYLNNIRFTFGEAGEVVPPSVPTNLTATAIDHASVYLAWEAAANAKKYYVYKDGEYLYETKETNDTVNNLSDGKEYCFTVKGVLNSSNVSEESDPACATTAVLPTPATPTNLAATSVTHNTVTLTWDAVQYAESYTVSYEATEITVTENTCFVTGLTPETPYTFSVKANNIKGSSLAAEISATTLANPFTGKLFRIKVANKTHAGKYLNINANSQPAAYSTDSKVGVDNEFDSPNQIFTIEDAPNGNYYLKSYNGYYIKCDNRAQTYYGNWWSVYAYSTTEKTPLMFEYIDSEQFYIRDYDKINGNSVTGDNNNPNNSYFKVNDNALVYCDATINTEQTVLWTVEEVVLKAAPETAPTNFAYSNLKHNSVTLSWDKVETADNYYLYNNGTFLTETTNTTCSIDVKSETEYRFTVTAVNISGESPVSEELVVITPKFEGRTIAFELNDYYSSGYYDGWNNNYLLITFSDGTPSLNLTHNGSASSEYYYIDVSYGTTVTVVYQKVGSYPSENTFYIRYKDDNSLIYQDGRAVNGGSAPSTNPYSFVVGRPSVKNLAANPSQIYPEDSTTLSWDAFNGAVSYNIYVNGIFKDNTTNTTYQLSNLPYNTTEGNAIEVSAVLESGETDKKTVNVKVTGLGSISVTITDGTHSINDVKFVLTGKDEFENDIKYTLTTNTDGKFLGDVLVGSYTLTITHDDYEEFVSTEIIDVIYGGDTYVEIELTARPEAIFTVTATESGNNANIEWNAEYASYNIYRKDTKTGEVEELGRNISANQYQDTDWLSLENTAYQYGVSANIIAGDSQMGTLIEEGFEYFPGAPLPEGWISNGNWSIISDGYNSDHSIYSGYNDGPHYLITPAINPKNATLSFAYRNWEYWGGYCELDVFYATTPNGQLSESLYHKNSTEDWEEISIDLNDIQEDQIYIIICNTNTNNGGENGLYIDNVVITGEATTYKESKINWSNVLVKAVFLGSVDTDWNTAANWSTGQVPGENNNVTIAANAEISSDVTVNTITINENASLSVNNAVLNVTYGIYNTTAANLIFSDGAQIIQPKDNVAATFNMNINPTDGEWNENNTTGWQFISLPFADAEFEDFTANSEDYDLYKYNGNKDNEWSNHKYVPTTETITVDTSTTVEAFVPSNINYKYTISQQIYLAEDFNGKSGKITGFSFMNAKELLYNNGNPYTATRKFEIYMINTDKSYFENTSDWVNIQASDLVFSGDITYGAKDTWTTITFNNPFEYNGENVILCVNDISANDAPMATNYHAMTTENKRSIYKYSDDNQYDASNLVDNITGGTANYVAYAQFSFETNTDGDIFGDTFQQGLGYLASYKSGTTATFEGTLNNATTFDYEVSHNADKYLANFHLLGNPFPFNMDWNKVQATGLVNGYAVVVDSTGGYDYLTTGTIPVGDGFFVKANAEDPTLYYDHSYVAPVSRGSEKSNSINVIASGKAGQDNVVINFAGQSEGFDKLQNFNEDIATVFVANNGKRYGIANVDENTTEVELSFVASQMGHYSISLDVNGEFETVTLVDRFTGIETNMLLEDEYNFTATSNDSHNRFVVRLTNGQEPTANSQFVYQSGEELILSIEGTVQIVDMLGRVVYYNEHANGDNRINVSEFNNAAYVVRVVNEEGVKTQKVVIY